MNILIAFIIQAIISITVFILCARIFSDPFQANGLAVVISAGTALVFGFIFRRSQDALKNQVSALLVQKSEIEAQSTDQAAKTDLRLYKVIEEVGRISDILGYTSGYMDSLTSQTKQNVEEISNAFNLVAQRASGETDSIDQISQLINQISDSIEGVALGAQEQAKSVSFAVNVSTLVNQMIEGITAKATNAATASAQAAAAADEGGKQIHEVIEVINHIREKVLQSAQKIQEMGVRSDEIGIIVEKIKDIASQTNLLALNAAIEAARAGEQGRGFAVVASEVRKLAENSAISTKEVNTLVNAIQESVREAITTMNLGISEVEKGVERANQSGAALESIINTTRVAYLGSKDVVELTQQQVSASKELSTAMESVSTVVEENSAATEEMSAGSEDILKLMDNISNVSKQNSVSAAEVAHLTGGINNLVTDGMASAQTLAEMASSLQNLISPYLIARETSKPTPRLRSSGKKPTIGIIVPTMSILFWKVAVDFALRGAQELGVELVVCDCQDKPELMEQHLKNLVTRKVDGVLWVPYWGLGPKGLAITRDAGIPVIIVDAYLAGIQPQSDTYPNYLAFIGPADETGAYEMAEYLLAQISPARDGKKYVVALDGAEGAPTAFIRHKGLVRALKEHPEAVLLASKGCNYNFDQAAAAFFDMLVKFPQIQGVWAANDTMIRGAISAAKKARRKLGSDLFSVGMDLDLESIKAVANGDQSFDIGGHWLQAGYGVGLLYDYLQGFSIPKGHSIIKLNMLPLTRDKTAQFEKDFPNGLPVYDFKQKSRAYNPKAPFAFFETKFSQ